jgi:hypothetical protein
MRVDGGELAEALGQARARMSGSVVTAGHRRMVAQRRHRAAAGPLGEMCYLCAQVFTPRRPAYPDELAARGRSQELIDAALVTELTVVRGDGRPMTYPLIPLWDGEKVLMTSSILFSRKLEHIKANPRSRSRSATRWRWADGRIGRPSRVTQR